MNDFLERHGLICIRKDEIYGGDSYVWSFPGLEYDWVIKTTEGSKSVLLCKSFFICSQEVHTKDLEDFYCSTPLDYMELSEKIKKLTLDYKKENSN